MTLERSRSQDRKEDSLFKDISDEEEHNSVIYSGMTPDQIEREKERQRRRIKKKRRRKNKRPYYELMGDTQVQNNIRNNINMDENIPDHLKTRLKKIELNPLALCLTGLPFSISKQEVMHYFNTYLKELVPSYEKENKEPIKKVEVGDGAKYGVLHVIDKNTADILVEKVEVLNYMNYKIKIERPKGFFNRIFKFNEEDQIFDQELLKLQHKLYMGNLPTYLTESELRKILVAIGPLKYLNLVRDYVNDVPVSRVSFSILGVAGRNLSADSNLGVGLLLLGVFGPQSDREGNYESQRTRNRRKEGQGPESDRRGPQHLRGRGPGG